MAEPKLMARWYFGGIASAGAACITHPLDLLKVYFYSLNLSSHIEKSYKKKKICLKSKQKLPNENFNKELFG